MTRPYQAGGALSMGWCTVPCGLEAGEDLFVEALAPGGAVVILSSPWTGCFRQHVLAVVETIGVMSLQNLNLEKGETNG